ncbi:MAG: DUF2804 domain-containing protein [Candidatus Helarchaeota archaeon]
MQREITTTSDLLNEKGEIIQAGWAKKLLLAYDRSKIRKGWHRIKEWDCYEIVNEQRALVLIIADIGYLGLGTISWLNFENQTIESSMLVKLFPKGSINLPATSAEGDCHFKKGEAEISFVNEGATRILSANHPKFKKKGLKAEISLYWDPKMDTMVNVIPFKNKKQFVYAQKVNCMPAKGTVSVGEETYEFTDDVTFACLDWSRAVFPYKTTWYWGSASGIVNGKPFGFNIDYGFGDETIATKNMIFYDGKGHKLDQVTFHINRKNYLEPWEFHSNDGRFEMKMEPVLDNCGSLNLLILKTGGHQVFGYFTGNVILDDGEKLHVDRLFGFAETFSHRW